MPIAKIIEDNIAYSIGVFIKFENYDYFTLGVISQNFLSHKNRMWRVAKLKKKKQNINNKVLLLLP